MLAGSEGPYVPKTRCSSTPPVMVMPVWVEIVLRIWWRLESLAATVSWPLRNVTEARWGLVGLGAPSGLVAAQGGVAQPAVEAAAAVVEVAGCCGRDVGCVGGSCDTRAGCGGPPCAWGNCGFCAVRLKGSDTSASMAAEMVALRRRVPEAGAGIDILMLGRLRALEGSLMQTE